MNALEGIPLVGHHIIHIQPVQGGFTGDMLELITSKLEDRHNKEEA